MIEAFDQLLTEQVDDTYAAIEGVIARLAGDGRLREVLEASA